MAMNIKISNELTLGLAMNSWKWFRVLLVLSLPIIIVEFLLQHNCASLFIVRLLHNWPVHPCDCALCTFCTFCSLDRRHQLLLIPPTHNNSMLGDAAVKPNKCEKKSRDKKKRPIGRQQQRNLWAVGGTSYLHETSEGTQGLSWPLAPRNNSRCRVVGGGLGQNTKVHFFCNEGKVAVVV